MLIESLVVFNNSIHSGSPFIGEYIISFIIIAACVKPGEIDFLIKLFELSSSFLNMLLAINLCSRLMLSTFQIN